ncbi:polyphosphatidylinositol phosphatase Inp53p [Trichomonascus vanleenenianus]|uniref:polyphosphatidylinositol phosphatase Inp53p n=1 Tax=Trichomonascus vanleenenianus TaxID=2268995 RepID=UPI003ECB240E
MKVLVKEQPRSLALASRDHVMVFRSIMTPSPKKGRKSDEEEGPRCIVEFAQTDSIGLQSYKPLSSNECHGFLGIINIDSDVYLCVITRQAQVASPRPGETISRIYGVEFHCLTRSDWDFITLDSNGYPIDVGSPTPGGTLDSRAPNFEHPCTSLRKLLGNGSFYYSTDFDLTSVLQNRGPEAKIINVDTIDESFMWNSYLMKELIKFRSRLPEEEKNQLDRCGFLTTAIRGFASTTTTTIGGKAAYLTLISRQSCKRAGTRYNARGVDDEGNVANFVETETVLYIENDKCFGLIQVRGSVPTFWEQDVNLLTAKVNITRSVEAAQPAFQKHMGGLLNRFGSVQIVNLLANKPGEIDLTKQYRKHLEISQGLRRASNVSMTEFDFHAAVARGGYAMAAKILPRLEHKMEEFSYYSYDINTGRDFMEQIGVFRTNCLDCLDRTNMIQQLISKEVLGIFLSDTGLPSSPELWNKHNFIWADNGDQLSQIYAGTNALKTSFTRSGKMNIAGALADVTKSVGRIYINNFVDKGRQNVMDVLLGKGEGQLAVVLYDPINDYVVAELHRRRQEFSSQRDISIFAGTFNLNGKFCDQDLSPWLFPHGEACDLYLIGFQEIVELTPGQILNTDPGKREMWEKRVLHCLNAQNKGQFVMLRSGQLVGTALLLFVRRDEVENVRDVEGATKKTGLGGMAGNKGGVAVSFRFCNTSFCFITAHLAAGQGAVEERHDDYKTISSGLRFSRGRRVKDHDSIIWLGDFNYRINLGNEVVRRSIESGDLHTLLEHDQLISQMERGETFPYYHEAPITFLPTYKFDNGTDTYDTSEKQRVPAWTDRILSRGPGLKSLSYGSAPLMFSDHRPVFSTFKANILVIDEEAKEALGSELYNSRRSEVGDMNDLVNLIDLNEVMLTHGLPPPSTDTKKWWIAGGQPAKVSLRPPHGDMILNPNKVNPFSVDSMTQPDYISKPALPPRPPVQRNDAVPPPPPPPARGSQVSLASMESSAPPSLQAPLIPRRAATSPPLQGPANSAQQGAPTSATSKPPALESTKCNSKGKPVPNVPRKPVALRPAEEHPPLLPPRANTLPPPPPPPRGSRSSSIMSSHSSNSLMDDPQSTDMKSWTPLQPK